DPIILLKRFRCICRNYNVCAEASDVQVISDFVADCGNGRQVDHRHTRLIENSVFEFHQLDRASKLLCDTVLQLRTSERKVCPFRRAHMSWRWLFRILSNSYWLIQKEFGKPAGRKPRKAALVVEATKRKAPISLQPVPTE